jgi:RNA polymerase sigma-70 factor (ECF subfamily)
VNWPSDLEKPRRSDFERLAHQHKDAVYRQMVRVYGNREDAEDVLIDALLKAYRSLDALGAEEAFRSWLGRIARRVCWQLRRREALLPLLQLSALEDGGEEAVDKAPSAEDQARVAEMKKILRAALDRLPREYRAVYELRALDELSGEETARQLGLSVGARKLLRKRLGAALVGDGRITIPQPKEKT